MEKETLKTRAADVLSKYPNKPCVFFTSDVNSFVNEGSAKAHAKGLPDKEITIITAEEAAGAAPASVGEPTAKPLNKMNVEELKAEVDKREGLTVAEKATKKEMQAAIEAYDEAKAKEAAAAAGDEPNGDAGNTGDPQ